MAVKRSRFTAKIRRIRRGDSTQRFKTGEHCFDYDLQGQAEDLSFYYARDISGKYESYVLVENAKITGVLCLQNRQNVLYVSRLGILNGHWSAGRGTLLMRFVLEEAIKRDMSKIVLEAHQDVVEYFIAGGFRVVKTYFDERWNGKVASMELDLSK